MIATEAASEGINLQFCSMMMINYDLPWNPQRVGGQRIGRIHRMGQQFDVVLWTLAIKVT